MHKIMILDDEPIILDLMRATLGSSYDVVCTTNCGEADQVFVSGTIDLLITDIWLGDGSGVEFAKKACEMDPGLKVIYMSGEPQGQDSPGPYLEKPFNPYDLKSIISAVLESIN